MVQKNERLKVLLNFFGNIPLYKDGVFEHIYTLKARNRTKHLANGAPRLSITKLILTANTHLTEAHFNQFDTFIKF